MTITSEIDLLSDDVNGCHVVVFCSLLNSCNCMASVVSVVTSERMTYLCTQLMQLSGFVRLALKSARPVSARSQFLLTCALTCGHEPTSSNSVGDGACTINSNMATYVLNSWSRYESDASPCRRQKLGTMKSELVWLIMM